MTYADFRADPEITQASDVWLYAPDGSSVTLQSLLDLLGPLKREPRIIDAVEWEPLWNLPHHPLANLFPLMAEDSPEFKALAEDIDEHGQHEPITLCDDMVLDGRNRQRACHAAGVKPIMVDFSDANEVSPLAFVLSKNLYRRHLTEGQRAMFALDLATTGHGGDRKSEKIKSPIGDLIGDRNVSRAEAAKLCGLSLRSVERAAFVRDHAVLEVVAKVEAGRMTLGRAAMLAKEDTAEQRAAPDVKFDVRRSRRPPRPSIPFTDTALKALTDEQAVVVVEKLTPKANRALNRKASGWSSWTRQTRTRRTTGGRNATGASIKPSHIRDYWSPVWCASKLPSR